MIDQNQVLRLLEFLSASERIFLLFANSQQPDLSLSVLASHLFFEDLVLLNKAKLKLKESVVFCPNQSIRSFKQLSAIENYLKQNELLEKIQHDLGRENLLITFPYKKNQVDKVSYHINDNEKHFYLTIKPKKGVSPLSHKEVEFSYTGSSANLLILFGVNDLEDLKELYVAHEELYQNTSLVTINTFLPDFGTLNLDISGSSAYGEATFYLLKSLSNILDAELNSFAHIEQIATLLLTSISLKTEQFSSKQTTANSFLAIAELLQLGAQRLELNSKKIVKKSKQDTKKSKQGTKKTTRKSSKK
jgi:hypothetical protein